MRPETVNKYYNSDLTFAQKATEQEVVNGKNLSAKHIKNLCSAFLTNAIYANVVEGDNDFEKGREKSFQIAGEIVLRHGKEIKAQLEENDKNAEQKNSGLETENNAEVDFESQPNTSEDIKKISSGTMAKIITKITEIMASMSPEERKFAAGNFGALFEVLDISFDKLEKSIQALEPNVVADIKDTLGEETFSQLIAKHQSPDQTEAVGKISQKDLEGHRKKMAQQQESKKDLSPSYER